MNQELILTTFGLLRSALCGVPFDKNQIEEGLDTQLFAFTNRFDLAGTVGEILTQNHISVSAKATSNFDQARLANMMRYVQSDYALREFSDLLIKDNIPFIPLKGAVIRNLYPNPWMRTSCDIDILVKKADIERICDLAKNLLHYTKGTVSPHDISLYTPGKVHIELHFDLIEENRVNHADQILKKVWDYAFPESGSKYALTDAMFYYYHVVHMAKHFEKGGCGLRPFLDLWILMNKKDANVAARKELLSKGNLLKFANHCERLAQAWLECRVPDDDLLALQEFVVTGGLYGTAKNEAVIRQQESGGKFRYFWSRVFMPYRILKNHYPVLKKHKWLLPFVQIKRWFQMLFNKNKRKKAISEAKYIVNVSEDQQSSMQDLLDRLGLSS